MSTTVEAKSRIPQGIKRLTRRAFFEKLAFYAGVTGVTGALIDKAYVELDIFSQVNTGIPPIIYNSDTRKDMTSKRNSLAAKKDKTPEQEESLKMVEQVIGFDNIQEPRRIARWNQLKSDSDNQIVFGSTTHSEIRHFAWQKGALLLAGALVSKLKIPDRMIKGLIRY